MTFPFIALTMILSCFAGEALAQRPAAAKPANEQESLADQRFFEGKAKARELKWDEALLLFEQSWRLKPSYDSAGNLGQVALRLGLYTKAATYLDRCLHMFPASGDKSQRAQIMALFREASAHVAAVHFAVGAHAGELVLDRTTELGSANSPRGAVYVNPGTHIVQLRQGNQVIAEQSFLAVADASQQVEISLPPATETQSAQTHEPAGIASAKGDLPAPFTGSADEHEARSLLPIVVGAGVGAASFIVAGVLLNSANRHLEQAEGLQSRLQGSAGDNACRNAANAQTCNQLHESLLSADRRYNWSYALFGVGGASLLGTLTYALWPLFSSRSEHRNASGPRVPLQVQVAGGAALLSCQTQF